MTPTREATVYVVDDDDAVRDSLLLLLDVKGYAAEGFASADAFLEAVAADWGGCLLLDLRMPGTSGLELQAALTERGIRLPIIVISAHGDVATARTAFKAGAVDFLEKPLDETTLIAAVVAALDRDRLRREHAAASAGLEERLARLSTREREVMWLVADGRQNRDIAASLGLSPRTVEIYKARMMEKLQLRGLPDLLQAVKLLRRNA
ncbi:MAG: response regulator [Casimicrobiaceae bacterium]